MSGKKHCGSISIFILKCSYLSFEDDKIKVKFRWFMTCEVWINWRNQDFCNMHEWMTYSPWWLRCRTPTCPYITSWTSFGRLVKRVFQKRFNFFFQFNSFYSYGPAVHLISWKIFVSHLHWLRLLAHEIMRQWKRLNWVTSHRFVRAASSSFYYSVS